MVWVHAVIDVPRHAHAAAARFWAEALGWPIGAPWRGHPELRSFEPPLGTAYVHLQEIDGPPRVHLDIEAQTPDETVRRAVDLGAAPVAEHDRWVTLQSPGGLPFCVVAAAAEHGLPEPVTWPDGHQSRMVQVSIDSPAAVHDEEVAFWRGLLPGRWVGSEAREFAGKWHDAGSPVQLLFQRLDEPRGSVRTHLDHGTDHRMAEVRRLLALGATDVAPGRGGWHVLRDPADLAFCVTDNSPANTRRRDLG